MCSVFIAECRMYAQIADVRDGTMCLREKLELFILIFFSSSVLPFFFGGDVSSSLSLRFYVRRGLCSDTKVYGNAIRFSVDIVTIIAAVSVVNSSSLYSGIAVADHSIHITSSTETE